MVFFFLHLFYFPIFWWKRKNNTVSAFAARIIFQIRHNSCLFHYTPYISPLQYANLKINNLEIIFHQLSIPSIDKGEYAFRQQNISSAKDSVRTILWAEVQRVFREQMGRFVKADEAAGLTPGNEDNAGSRFICREKPCLLLSIDGMKFRKAKAFSWEEVSSVWTIWYTTADH